MTRDKKTEIGWETRWTSNKTVVCPAKDGDHTRSRLWCWSSSVRTRDDSVGQVFYWTVTVEWQRWRLCCVGEGGAWHYHEWRRLNRGVGQWASYSNQSIVKASSSVDACPRKIISVWCGVPYRLTYMFWILILYRGFHAEGQGVIMCLIWDPR